MSFIKQAFSLLGVPSLALVASMQSDPFVTKSDESVQPSVQNAKDIVEFTLTPPLSKENA
jgi:hypothetical protein